MTSKALLRMMAFLPVLLFPLISSAQAGPEMADDMRSSGKIFVVVGCVLLVLFGMIAFLLLLEGRLSKLEKQDKHEN